MKKHVWFLLALSLVVGSCRHFLGKRVHGNGSIRTEERNVDNFKSLDISLAAKVYVSQGDQHSVKIEADDNLLPYINVSQEGDQVIVKGRKGFNLISTHDIKVYVTAPVFSKIESSGACDIIGQTKIVNPEELELSSSGVGDIKMEVDAPQLTAQISGTGSIDLKGQTKDLSIEMSGVGHAHCYDLLAENTTVTISGVGSAEVYASVKLEAEVSGAGNVSYKGNATNVSQHVSGAGSVNKTN
jgi:hypothetical protein